MLGGGECEAQQEILAPLTSAKMDVRTEAGHPPLTRQGFGDMFVVKKA